MGEEVAQRHKDIAILLAAGGDHRLQAGIHPYPMVGAKATAHFLLDFGRAQVSFGLVVGERHALHQRKGQNRVLVLRHTTKQIASWRALRAASAHLGFGRRFFQFRLAQDLAILLLGSSSSFPLQGESLTVELQQKGVHRALQKILQNSSKISSQKS